MQCPDRLLSEGVVFWNLLEFMVPPSPRELAACLLPLPNTGVKHYTRVGDDATPASIETLCAAATTAKRVRAAPP